MTTLVRATAADIVPIVARLLGQRRESFTAASATATTVVAPTGGLRSTTANDYANLYVYVVSGTGIGQTRVVTSSATLTLTVPTWTTNPDSTSVILVLNADPSVIFESVGDAIRRASRVLYPPFADTSLKFGNILSNGHLQYWDGSATVASGSAILTRDVSDNTGWIVRGTGATGQREVLFARNLTSLDTYGGEIVTDGVNDGYFEQLIQNWGRYANETFDMEVWAYATAATRARGRLSDGVTTFLTNLGGTSGDHSGTAGWERLERQAFQIDDQATQIAFQCYVVSGGAQTVRFDDPGLYPRSHVPLYRLPPWMTRLSDIYVERGRPTIGSDGLPDQSGSGIGDFYPTPISHNSWNIVRQEPDGLPYLWISQGAGIPWKYHLKLVGTGYRTDTIAAGTNIEFHPQLIAHMAASQMVTGLYDFANVRLKADLDRKVDEMIATDPWRHAPPGSRLVR